MQCRAFERWINTASLSQHFLFTIKKKIDFPSKAPLTFLFTLTLPTLQAVLMSRTDYKDYCVLHFDRHLDWRLWRVLELLINIIIWWISMMVIVSHFSFQHSIGNWLQTDANHPKKETMIATVLYFIQALFIFIIYRNPPKKHLDAWKNNYDWKNTITLFKQNISQNDVC